MTFRTVGSHHLPRSVTCCWPGVTENVTPDDSCQRHHLASGQRLLRKRKDVPKANVAVLDGNEHAPGQSWKRGKLSVRTLWGELAWQLGGA